MLRKYRYAKIEPVPGISREPDSTALSTPTWSDGNLVRWSGGKLKSIGGWVAPVFNNTISGCARNIFSYFYSNKQRYLVGTNEKLYEVIGSTITNITPLSTSTTAIANSLNSNYATLANNPFTTVDGSMTVTMDYSAITDVQLREGDVVSVTGSGSVNGISNTLINTTHILASVDSVAETATFIVSSAATSSGAGGGGSVVLATALVGVTDTAHGMADGDRVVLAAATDFAGLQASEINAEHIIRKESDDKFSIYVSTVATSAATAGGGASTTYATEIADGECDYRKAIGWGGGVWGAVGQKWGEAGTFSNLFDYPRIYSMARFGNDVVMTPGQQTGVYLYASDNSVAPAALTNAPTAVNWVFESDNAVCTLGAAGVGNRIKTSDVGDATEWTPSATTLAFEDDIEGAEDFISQINVRGINLLFTENQVWRFRYVGVDSGIWETEQLDSTDGIAGPLARVAVGGIAYWMGQHDFYMYDGGIIRPIPNNTLKRYVFDNLSLQKWKSHAWVNRAFNEIWWHIPRVGSNEPNYYIVFNYVDGIWYDGFMERTAAEQPIHLTAEPYLIDSSNVLYRHESGNNANDAALNSYAETNWLMLGEGDETMHVMSYMHDATQEGNMKITFKSKLYPQASAERSFGPYTVAPTTEKVNFRAHGRVMKARFEKDALNTSFTLGQPRMGLQKGSAR